MLMTVMNEEVWTPPVYIFILEYVTIVYFGAKIFWNTDRDPPSTRQV